MATIMHISQEGLNDQSSQVVAIYRFVIVDGKACTDDALEQSVWTSKDTSRKHRTYSPHLARKGWKATFGNAYSDAGIINTLKILDPDGRLMKAMDQKPRDKAGVHSERWPSQGASGVLDKQIEGLGQKTSWRMVLGTQGSTEGNDGNDLFRFCLVRCPVGVEGAMQEDLALWCAKKEVSDEANNGPERGGIGEI